LSCDLRSNEKRGVIDAMVRVQVDSWFQQSRVVPCRLVIGLGEPKTIDRGSAVGQYRFHSPFEHGSTPKTCQIQVGCVELPQPAEADVPLIPHREHVPFQVDPYELRRVSGIVEVAVVDELLRGTNREPLFLGIGLAGSARDLWIGSIVLTRSDRPDPNLRNLVLDPVRFLVHSTTSGLGLLVAKIEFLGLVHDALPREVITHCTSYDFEFLLIRSKENESVPLGPP